MIDTESIILRYYDKESKLYEVLMLHSRQVAALCAQLCYRLTERMQPIDADFVAEAAMLHDIGIFKTNAPSIYCTGTEPYICHGLIGRQLLEGIGLFRHALVCERHTGAGLTCQEIIDQKLPLPHRDMVPLSLEEQVVCYADKFYSKSHIAPCRNLSKARGKLAKFGQATLDRFDAMAAIFGEPDYDKLDQDLR